MSIRNSAYIDLSEPGCIPKSAIRVIIDGQQADTPFYVDRDLLCASTDGRPIIVSLVSDGTQEVTEIDGSPLVDSATPTNCEDKDVEPVTECYQDISDPSIKYTRVTWFEADDLTVIVSTAWLDASGALVPAPANVEPCKVADEIDVVVANWLPICVDGVQYYARENHTVNNTSGIITNTTIEYKEGVDGVITTTAPTGTEITENYCPTAIDFPTVTCASNLSTTVTEATDANIAATSTFLGAAPSPYHTQLDNNLSLVGVQSGFYIMSGLNFEVVGGTYTGATFTYTVTQTGDSDPGDPSDFVIFLMNNNTVDLVQATSITSDATFFYDPYSPNTFPIYSAPSLNTPYTVTWTGDLPEGSYSVMFLGQDQVVSDDPGSVVDAFTVSIAYPANQTPAEEQALLVGLNQCTLDQVNTRLEAIEQKLTNPQTTSRNIMINSPTSLESLIGTGVTVTSLTIAGLNGVNYNYSTDSGASYVENSSPITLGDTNNLSIVGRYVDIAAPGTFVNIFWEEY